MNRGGLGARDDSGGVGFLWSRHGLQEATRRGGMTRAVTLIRLFRRDLGGGSSSGLGFRARIMSLVKENLVNFRADWL